ncbi:hypothetical protein HS7_21090 [Sulfolobales archaeon HS-7]|nr:hypothetical protein HS7_21090 [Sulfolobales archaeon HS-7]
MLFMSIECDRPPLTEEEKRKVKEKLARGKQKEFKFG